ncbi:ADL238Wp [Eremothecium gossypii ATCC 10895]|uniref:ADL238Wp n=1 Tax=Eremothecium gossypii (strain ATCC 10895 / CBS 109.51 / FGSC 9923 / NRRL Y-1056) TaxID=284811 RepID=Q75B15_EREGS|nr:ADL238Wp [Eremothecium gossypii ATCC 10895]AAS51682.2 ADL238Wp [Eremothecium gossypii ATCC 10895]
MASIELFNLVDGYEVYSPALVIHGRCRSEKASSIQVHHPELPFLTYQVHCQTFKALVHLVPGANVLTFTTDENEHITVTCTYAPQAEAPPIHLCILVAKDSPMVFDSPAVQRQREGGCGMDLAIKKLRCGARLMQAFTNEQMLRNGFGHRCFQFAEEVTTDTLFREPKERRTIKIHIVRSKLSTAEIRDPNLAQQNPNGSNTGGLFNVALEALQEYGGPFGDSSQPVQAAVIFMDTHWDPQAKLITAHAALGGGAGHIRLAIFGSHGLYSWPPSLELVPYYMSDPTPSSIMEVANDCNECGTHWECLTVTLGAFMHEIGHLLGCPHQEHGVMLRDYVTLNRSFMTMEGYSSRTNSCGAPAPIRPAEECTWHRLDLLRFLYHPSFANPTNYSDPSFKGVGVLSNFPFPRPTLYPCGNRQAVVSAQGGIYCIELISGDLARAHIEYLPLSLGGQGPQTDVLLSLDDLRARIPQQHLVDCKGIFKVAVHAVNSESAEFDDFPSKIYAQEISMAPYGYPALVTGIKGTMLGNPEGGGDAGIISIFPREVEAVRVYHGYALDGIRFYFRSPQQINDDAAGSHDYFRKLKNSLKGPSRNRSASALFGRETNNYSDFVLSPDESLLGFNVRSGCWIDAVQIITSQGRTSPLFGNTSGGGLGTLVPPTGYEVLALHGRVGQWVDAMGIIYGNGG